jgi:hypothetical protein
LLLLLLLLLLRLLGVWKGVLLLVLPSVLQLLRLAVRLLLDAALT